MSAPPGAGSSAAGGTAATGSSVQPPPPLTLRRSISAFDEMGGSGAGAGHGAGGAGPVIGVQPAPLSNTSLVGGAAVGSGTWAVTPLSAGSVATPLSNGGIMTPVPVPATPLTMTNTAAVAAAAAAAAVSGSGELPPLPHSSAGGQPPHRSVFFGSNRGLLHRTSASTALAAISAIDEKDFAVTDDLPPLHSAAATPGTNPAKQAPVSVGGASAAAAVTAGGIFDRTAHGSAGAGAGSASSMALGAGGGAVVRSGAAGGVVGLPSGLLSVFYAEFDNILGPKIAVQAPRSFLRADEFDDVSDFIITAPELCHRLITFRHRRKPIAVAAAAAAASAAAAIASAAAPGGAVPVPVSVHGPAPASASVLPVPSDITILGYPVALSHNKYHRNALLFNVGFVFDSAAADDLYPFQAVLRKLACLIETLEVEAEFLYKEQTKALLQPLIDHVLVQLTTYGECSLAISMYCAATPLH
jgi:hypothetical protein